jgi:UrcA family protein
MTSYFNNIVLCASLAGAVLLASAERASAEPQEPANSVRVSFADLDISHPAGAETLLTRIERAAVTVCGEEEPGLPLLARDFAYRQCREDAVSQAVSRMNAPMLTAVAGRNFKRIRLASH